MPAIAHRETGDAAGRPLLILHGLFGSGRNWASIARALASDGWRVFALDAPNHGSSDWTDHPVTYPQMADEIEKWMTGHGVESAHVIGHSMGGKIAMRLALDHGRRVKALAVVDIAPVPYSGRDHLAYIEAMKSVDLNGVKRRSQVGDALAARIEPDSIRLFLMQNLVADEAAGGLRWRLNLDGLARSMDALMDFPLQADMRPCGAPTLFLAGGASAYVAPGSEGVRDRLFPDNTLVTLDGLGHWPHAENPALFLEKTNAFLTLRGASPAKT